MMLRYLRIAVTVTGVTTCVLLAALLVRSFGRQHSMTTPIPGLAGGVEINSLYGRIDVLGRFRGEPWPVRTWSTDPISALMGCVNVYDLEIALPHWGLAAAAATIAWAPWIRWQFSLRTLLIAVTLVALLLGMSAASM